MNQYTNNLGRKRGSCILTLGPMYVLGRFGLWHHNFKRTQRVFHRRPTDEQTHGADVLLVLRAANVFLKHR